MSDYRVNDPDGCSTLVLVLLLMVIVGCTVLAFSVVLR